MEFKSKLLRLKLIMLIIFLGLSFVKSQIRYKGELEIDLNKSRSIDYLKEIGKNEYTDLRLYADKKYDIDGLKLDPGVEFRGIRAAIYLGKMGDENISMIVGESFINVQIKGKDLIVKKTIRTLDRFEKKQIRQYDKESGIESRGKYILIDEEKNREYELLSSKGRKPLECKYGSKNSKFKRKHHNIRDAGIPHFPNEYVGKRSFEIKIWDVTKPTSSQLAFYKSYIDVLRSSSDKFRDIKITISFAPEADVNNFYKNVYKDGALKGELIESFGSNFSNDRKRVINSFNSKKNRENSAGKAYLHDPEGKISNDLWREKKMIFWSNYDSYNKQAKVTFTHEISHNLGAVHTGYRDDLMFIIVHAQSKLYHKDISNIDKINKSLGFLLKEPSKIIDLGTIDVNERYKDFSGSTVNKGMSKHSGISHPASNMVYKFKVSESANYLLDIQDANYDTYLYLLDEKGDLMAKDDDGGASRYWSRLSWKKFEKTKTYYAIISGYKMLEGNYGKFIIWSHKGLFLGKSNDANKDLEGVLELPDRDLKKSNTDNGYSKKEKGVSVEKEANKIKIYPTVCKYLLNIDNQGDLGGDYFSLKIYDSRGRLVQGNDKQRWGEVRLDEDLTDGMYILKVEIPNKIKFINKIIVNRN